MLAPESLDRSRPAALTAGLARSWPIIAIAGLGLAVTLLFVATSLWRHDALGTNAEDLGFTAQAIWNTTQGRFLEFSLYDQPAFELDIDPRAVATPRSLLAYHFMPALALLALPYAVWPDPRLLLVLQAIAGGLAVPAAWWLGRAVGLGRATSLIPAALLAASPFLASAVLSDVHSVVFAVPLLLAGLALAWTDRPWWSAACALGAALCREDAALTVAGLGLALVLLGRRRDGVAWLAIAVITVIIGTVVTSLLAGGAPPLSVRYSALGGSLAGALPVVLQNPGVIMGELTRLHVLTWISQVIATSGGAILVVPAAWPGLAPTVILNGLSSSAFMSTGAAHYSVLALPTLALAGAVLLQRTAARWKQTAALVMLALPVLALLTWPSLWSWQHSRLDYDGRTGASRVAAALALIPNSAAVAASSGLVPRLANRAELYLFPTVDRADWIILDRRNHTYPLPQAEFDDYVTWLLADPAWSLLRDGDDGVLVLQRATRGG